MQLLTKPVSFCIEKDLLDSTSPCNIRFKWCENGPTENHKKGISIVSGVPAFQKYYAKGMRWGGGAKG